MHRSSSYRRQSFEHLLHYEFTRRRFFCTGKFSSFALANFHRLSPNRDNHSRNAARLVSLSVQFPRSMSIARIFATNLPACRSIRKWKKKYKLFPRRQKLWRALLTFFEYNQLPLMLYAFLQEVAIVVPLFSFFVIFGMYYFLRKNYFLFCTLPFPMWGLFWVLWGPQKEPPHRYSHVFGFLYGYRVESSRAAAA